MLALVVAQNATLKPLQTLKIHFSFTTSTARCDIIYRDEP
jgi:hypothetical protein